ncbi:MFS transporter [Acidothermaceae bacterium B102]|nr:MFS transporter [Acidothermaceae bacterium B102]
MIWAIGLVAYVVAVFNRNSLGVTGVTAQQRFHASAGVLAVFSVVQIAVYAALQVPVGMVLDRLGSRRMLAVGGLLMALGQAALATSHSVPAAIGARILVGAGDAMTFNSVLRLVTLWFPPRKIPLVTQVTGIVGQLGQLAAAYPLVALLSGVGWTGSFATVAVVGLVVTVVIAVTLTDTPAHHVAPAEPPSMADMRQLLVHAWGEPGTQLGLWTHLVTGFSGATFALLWGFPFLTKGEGRSNATAGVLLSVMVGAAIVVGPLLGQLAARWPLRRSALVFGIVGATVSSWTVVLLWPGRAPTWLLVLLVVSLATNGPGSLVGFDYARTFNPAGRIGSASGIVNVGAFSATLVTILGVGLVLDALTPHGSTAYTLSSFRWAFSLQYLVWAAGFVLFIRARREVRARLATEGVVPDALPSALVRRIRERH